MSKLSVDQQTVYDLFSSKKANFFIPDYQRPYAWGEVECQTLWDDFFEFAFPERDYSKFNRDEEYYLGPIVFFPSTDKLEVIDGQQRLTTLMLLLRAFYKKFAHMQDEGSLETKRKIERCIWKTDEFGKPDMGALKIDSEVATDGDKAEFLSILKTGEAEGMKSVYARNYLFFQSSIDKFLDDYPSYFAYFPTRILNNCILLPIEADEMETALRIFSTLNDRGKPLSDADIFKAQFYKYFSDLDKKEKFIQEWKELEELCGRIFHPSVGTPMDELFTRYMYYERAKKSITSSTTESLRKFYMKDNYALLKKEETFLNLIKLAYFWNDVKNQNSDVFSPEVLRCLFVLNYAPNGMWTYIVSVYFMQNKDSSGLLDEKKFVAFLNRIIAFIWTYAVTNPGVNALRTPVFAEMFNIVQGRAVQFADYQFDVGRVRETFALFSFNNRRPITKSMLTWWAMHNLKQPLPSLETAFEIEHILSINLQKKHHILINEDNLDVLGNKAILEKRINIRAADYRFVDKKKYYKGSDDDKKGRTGTINVELCDIADTMDNFGEKDIEMRFQKILDAFITYLGENGLTK